MKTELLINKLREEVQLATGCTEPVAVALAVANAYRLVGGEVKAIKLVVSSNVFKNAKAVGIPGTERTGVAMAALLAVSMMRPKLDLTIFSSLRKKEVAKALLLEETVELQVEVDYTFPPVQIEVLVNTDRGRAKAIISQKHTGLVYLEKNNEILLDQREEANEAQASREFLLSNYSLEDILAASLRLDPEAISFLLEGIEVNIKVALAGLKLNTGLKIGHMWNNLNRKGLLGRELTMEIAKYTAAACDARMSGLELPVMSSAGSGNHGLIAIIPLALVAREFDSSRQDLIYALAISHLVNIYIKEEIGRLSPLCGCSVAAGAGVGAGITYLLQGNMEQMVTTIKNVMASLAGMVCDGGKVGCALKLCISATTAWWNALLALEGLAVPSDNGIVADDLQQSITNLRRLNSEGMKDVDRVVISILGAADQQTKAGNCLSWN